MKRPIGILGGMGPAATIDLMQRVMEAVDARDDADHIPLIVHQNTQVPSRIAHLIQDTGEDAAPALAAMAIDLERAGAVALAMPCNTAHHYAQTVEAATHLPFLDMVALVCRHVKEIIRTPADSSVPKLGLLGSPALAKVGVYDNHEQAAGIDILHADPAGKALDLIHAIKADGVTDWARAELAGIANELLDRGAGAICIACTEFSLIKDALQMIPAPTFDAIDLLVAEIVRVSTSENAREASPPLGQTSRPLQAANDQAKIKETGRLLQ